MGRVFRLYRPVFWRATPQAEIAPVQDVSVVGLAFWVSGSGWPVEMIQSALPAVSPLLLSKSTRFGATAAVVAAVVAAVAVVAAEAWCGTTPAAGQQYQSGGGDGQGPGGVRGSDHVSTLLVRGVTRGARYARRRGHTVSCSGKRSLNGTRRFNIFRTPAEPSGGARKGGHARRAAAGALVPPSTRVQGSWQPPSTRPRVGP